MPAHAADGSIGVRQNAEGMRKQCIYGQIQGDFHSNPTADSDYILRMLMLIRQKQGCPGIHHHPFSNSLEFTNSFFYVFIGLFLICLSAGLVAGYSEKLAGIVILGLIAATVIAISLGSAREKAMKRTWKQYRGRQMTEETVCACVSKLEECQTRSYISLIPIWKELLAVVIVGAFGWYAMSNMNNILSEEQIYNATMRVLDKGTAVAPGGDALTAYWVKDDIYSTQGIPEALASQSPDEVAAIIRFTKDRVYAGQYKPQGKNYKHNATGYRHTLKVEWLDLSSGRVTDKKTFYGEVPPEAVMVDNYTNDVYGSDVSMEQVQDWVWETWDEHIRAGNP